MVPDTKEDDRFRDNPLVQADPRIRFYAGPAPGSSRAKLGTLCLIDDKPRTFDARDIEVEGLCGARGGRAWGLPR